MSKRKIYLDLDGVLADLDGMVLEMTGKEYREHDSTELWAFIDTHPDFFFRLKKMPDADELVEGVQTVARNIDADVGILTALPYRSKIGPAVKHHKRLWVEKHYGGLPFDVGPFSMDKWQHCKPGDVLIDDSTMNIADWGKAGGVAILHVNATESLRRLMLGVSGV